MNCELVDSEQASHSACQECSKPVFSFQFINMGSLDRGAVKEIGEFLDRQETSHPFQHPHWADGNSYFALLRRDERICWVASCGIQYPFTDRVRALRTVTVNRGPVCDDPWLWRHGVTVFLEHLHEHGFVYVDASPEWVLSDSSPQQFDIKWQQRSAPRTSLRLSLKPDTAVLLAGFRKATRYEIHRAERASVSIAHAENGGQIGQFLDIYQDMSLRKQFQADSPSHMRSVIRWLLEERSRGTLLLADSGDHVLGGAVIVRSGKRCWYVWGATQKSAQVSAGHILLWNALLWSKSQGCTEFDFGGYTDNATSGPAWFKKGFGGDVVYFPGLHRSILRSLSYRVLEMTSRA